MSASQHFKNMAAGKAPPTQITVAYSLFAACALTVYHFVANGEFSSILTMSVMVQCLALALLAIHTRSRGSAHGVSAQSLILEAISFGTRLSSTTWLNGYLPVDASGDFVYQAVDVCSLLLVLWLLYQVYTSQGRSAYDHQEDTLPAWPFALAALALAAIFHADMNSRPVFDTLWMTGLFAGVFAVLPQLWLIVRTGGVIQACTSHWIAMTALSRLLSGLFMWHARFDITCAFWVEGVNHAIWAILAAHALHLLLLGDFTYQYVRAVASQGLTCNIDLNAALDVV